MTHSLQNVNRVLTVISLSLPYPNCLIMLDAKAIATRAYQSLSLKGILQLVTIDLPPTSNPEPQSIGKERSQIRRKRLRIPPMVVC
jgi:hypothetical protein